MIASLDPASAELAALPGALRDALLDRLGGENLDLPVLPSVAAEVLSLAHNETADAARISALIHRDQALAGQVLRIANSAAYRPRAPIVSLQQAVARLGLQALAEITLAISVQGSVFQAPGHEALVRAQWQHSALAGAFGKEVARTRRQNVESAFLCGLLHDVGRPITLAMLVDAAKGVRATLADATIAGVLDLLHTQVGLLLATRWALPAVVAAAVRWHHAPNDAQTSVDAVRMTQLADRLSHFALEPSAENEQALRSLSVVAELNLYPDQVDALLLHRERALAFAEAVA